MFGFKIMFVRQGWAGFHQNFSKPSFGTALLTDHRCDSWELSYLRLRSTLPGGNTDCPPHFLSEESKLESHRVKDNSTLKIILCDYLKCYFVFLIFCYFGFTTKLSKILEYDEFK